MQPSVLAIWKRTTSTRFNTCLANPENLVRARGHLCRTRTIGTRFLWALPYVKHPGTESE